MERRDDDGVDLPRGLARVPLGIGLVLVGFVTSLVLFSIWLPSLFIGSQTAALYFRLGPFVALSAAVGTSIGKALCLTAPAGVSGRGPLLAAVLIDFYGYVMGVASALGSPPALLLSLREVMWVIGMLCFVMFLRHLGHFLKRSDIVGQATTLLCVGWGVVVTNVALIATFVLVDAQSLPAENGAIAQVLLTSCLAVSAFVSVIR
jgi:hypothetical protein